MILRDSLFQTTSDWTMLLARMFSNTYFVLGLVIAQLVFSSPIYSANILYLCGVSGNSIKAWNLAIIRALASKGHNLTVLANIQEPAPPLSNVKFIYLEDVDRFVEEEEDLGVEHTAGVWTAREIGYSVKFCVSISRGIAHSNGVRSLLDYPNDFHVDLILYDYLCGPFLLGFMHKFNYPPLIGVSSFGMLTITTNMAGGHNYFSYQPFYGASLGGRMSFWERVTNMFYFAVENCLWEYDALPTIDELAAEVYGPECPPVSQLEHRAQLALVNTDPAIHQAIPMPPNTIPVGGLHIKEPKKLPIDIEQFVSAGKNGTILFSMGGNIRSADIGIEKQRIILNAFQQLPQYNFLWKFEEPEFPLELPSNVMIRKWLPQNDLLPNLKAFITHGGALSVMEAIHYGVPMIGIPFYGDQRMLVHKLWETGLAARIYFPTMTTIELKEKLLMVLCDPGYAKRASIQSLRFRDQPKKPLDRAIWWIEYILRNPDASHLKVPTNELGFIRSNSLDLYGIIFVIISAIIICSVALTWRLISFFCSKAKTLKLDYCH